jgi:glutamate N-acetyltransferase/amino-acid N-acetyltransferase
LSIKFGDLFIIQNGKLSANYTEEKASDYMRSDNIEINIEVGNGSKNFTVYTMDFTEKYIEINSDYRS